MVVQQRKRCFGQEGEGPVYDNCQDHAHIWKKPRNINLIYSQEPSRMFTDEKTIANPDIAHCSVCHCAKPFTFTMRSIDIQPYSGWEIFDDYNRDTKLNKKDSVDILNTGLSELSFKEIEEDDSIDTLDTGLNLLSFKEVKVKTVPLAVTQTTELLSTLSECYFDSYIIAIQASDYAIAQFFITKSLSYDPYNTILQDNVKSFTSWLLDEYRVIFNQNSNILGNMDRVISQITSRLTVSKPQTSLCSFSSEEKRKRSVLRASLLKPITDQELSLDKTLRSKRSGKRSAQRHPLIVTWHITDDYITPKWDGGGISRSRWRSRNSKTLSITD